ncbi:hypothetical protein FB451DRAFT_1365354 [Mycena latifolia]|nr:hypothetical protein FB451DRAFT_1365354 [Mycena latifolia]
MSLNAAGDDPEALKVREWRWKLQKSFLSPSGPVAQDYIPAIANLFTAVERYENMTDEYLALRLTPVQFSKIGKVMRQIYFLDAKMIAGEAEFNFRDRAEALIDKWNQVTLSAHAPPSSPAAGMHRCLDIIELVVLVEIICSYLFLLPRGEKALVALARTCKKLQGPALNRLWRNQNTLRNILSCMPPGVFHIHEEPNPDVVGGPVRRRMRLLRPILAADWQRPIEYARCVKSLAVSRSDSNRVSDILPVLSSCIPGDCLLPNLRTLKWFPGGDDFLHMRILLAPTLTTLFFSCDLSPSNLSFLPTIARTCTALKELNIGLPIPTGPGSALKHIGQLPTLTSLNVTSFKLGLSSTPQVPSPGFTALQTLALEVDDIRQGTTFFHLCSLSSLLHIDVTFFSCPPLRGMDTFCTALKASCSHDSLLSLVLDTDGGNDLPEGVGEETIIIDNDAMRTLFCFGNLTWMSIMSLVGFDFDNSTITDMARAWPHATTLLLKYGGERRPRNTLECLYAFAQHCPDLERLHITLDATPLPTGTRRASQRRLKYLNVAQSPISAPTLEVARIMSAIFPGLEDLSTYRDGVDDTDEGEPEPKIIRWTSVGRSLRAGRKLTNPSQCFWPSVQRSAPGHGRIWARTVVISPVVPVCFTPNTAPILLTTCPFAPPSKILPTSERPKQLLWCSHALLGFHMHDLESRIYVVGRGHSGYDVLGLLQKNSSKLQQTVLYAGQTCEGITKIPSYEELRWVGWQWLENLRSNNIPSPVKKRV